MIIFWLNDRPYFRFWQKSAHESDNNAYIEESDGKGIRVHMSYIVKLRKLRIVNPWSPKSQISK